MYKALIVDDEKLDRLGLNQQIDWSSFNITIVELASDAYEALNLLATRPVDLLITDVKMPGMTGHELLEEAKKLYPSIETIFISGYDDFNYVRNALRLEASEYILKPVNTRELTNALTRVVGKMDSFRQKTLEKQTLLKHINDGSTYARENILKDLLFGVIDKTNAWQLIEQWKIHLYKNFFNVSIIELDFNEEYIKEIDKPYIERQIDCNLDKSHDQEMAYTYLVDDQLRILLISSSKYENADLAYKSMRTSMGLLYNNLIDQLFQCKLTMAIGQQVNRLVDLSVSYKNASEKMMQKMIFGKGQLFVDDLQEVEAIDEEQVAKIIGEIIESTLLLDDIKLNHLVNHLFDYLITKNIYEKTLLQDICLNMISRVQIHISERHISFHEIFGSNEIVWEKLMKFDTIVDIRQWVKNIFRSMIEYMKGMTISSDKGIVNYMINEVHDHYMSSITLKNMAEKLNYSPNHLGYIFKEEMSQGFNEFLIEYRMKQAVLLLENPKYKLYEIAEKVSYKNMNAFTNQFKKYYGMTPKHYKNRNIKHR